MYIQIYKYIYIYIYIYTYIYDIYKYIYMIYIYLHYVYNDKIIIYIIFLISVVGKLVISEKIVRKQVLQAPEYTRESLLEKVKSEFGLKKLTFNITYDPVIQKA